MDTDNGGLNESTSILPSGEDFVESGPRCLSELTGLENQPAGSALLVIKRGPNSGSRFMLDKPVTSAGRHPASDIFLDDVTVSRKHAEFRWEKDELHIVDLGSLNGTFVNRLAVDSAVLADRDEVQLGKFRLIFLTQPKNR